MTLCPQSFHWKKHKVFDDPRIQHFQSANMRSRYFRNSDLVPFSDLKPISIFFTATIAGQMKLLERQILHKTIFQQSEHSIWTKNYSQMGVNFRVKCSIDPASTAKQSDLNLPKIPKICTKYKYNFLTSDRSLLTDYQRECQDIHGLKSCNIVIF